MPTNTRIISVIPVTNLTRAREFYEDLLGLSIYIEVPEQALVTYHSNGTYLSIYQRQSASSGDHTIAGFEVGNDFDNIVNRLLANGLRFETFEIPGMDNAWDNRGVLAEGNRASAWFKDPDGNFLVISRGNL